MITGRLLRSRLWRTNLRSSDVGTGPSEEDELDGMTWGVDTGGEVGGAVGE